MWFYSNWWKTFALLIIFLFKKESVSLYTKLELKASLFIFYYFIAVIFLIEQLHTWCNLFLNVKTANITRSHDRQVVQIQFRVQRGDHVKAFLNVILIFRFPLMLHLCPMNTRISPDDDEVSLCQIDTHVHEHPCMRRVVSLQLYKCWSRHLNSTVLESSWHNIT